jgi:hypothetical protein
VPDPITPDAYRERLERISELFSSMMDTVNDLSARRCPYKNRFDECTARFGCRNQRKSGNSAERKVCGGDDKLDYRSAWEAG